MRCTILASPRLDIGVPDPQQQRGKTSVLIRDRTDGNDIQQLGDRGIPHARQRLLDIDRRWTDGHSELPLESGAGIGAQAPDPGDEIRAEDDIAVM